MLLPNRSTFLFYLLFCSIAFNGIAQSQSSQKEVQSDEARSEVDSLVQIVRGYYYDKDYKNAIEQGERVLELSEEIGYLKPYVNASSLVGTSLLQLGDTIQSQKIFENALLKAKKLDDFESILTASIDLGNVYAISKRFEAAINSYQNVLPLAEQTNDTISLFLLNYNIGESYLELDQHNQAEKYIRSTEAYVEDLALAYQAGQRSLLGKYYLQAGDYDSSAQALEQGVQWAQESDFKEIELEIFKTYATVEKERGDYQGAYNKLKRFNELNEEKYRLDKITAVENAVAKFKVKQMEQELQNAQFQQELAQARTLRNVQLSIGITTILFLSIVLLVLYITHMRRKKLLVNLQENNRLLKLARDKSDKLRKAKDALFSRISHELRTPMYGIIGISNLMLDDQKEAKNPDNIKSLKYSADYLLSLINNVLETNRMNRVKEDLLKKEPFNLFEVCNYAMDSTRYIAQNDSNKFVLDIEEGIPEIVIGDSSRLSQVLINLLGNSSKFTENGEVCLKLTLDAMIDPNKACIKFAVIDNGIGIPLARQETIFEEAPSIEHHHENEGTGLGLPISKKIIELHGSEIHLNSKEGNGTEIFFTICYTTQEEQLSHPNSAVNTGVNDTARMKGAKILVVEDNKVNQMVTRKILENLGAEVTLVNSGEEAVLEVKERCYQLIFMDINMPPGIDGFEASTRIRQFNKATPIIALTAVEQVEIKTRMRDSDMNDYIIKPFDKEKFQNKILQYLV